MFGNVIKAQGAAKEGLKSSFPAFPAYTIARKQFFADLAYAIYLTGPTDESGEVTMPEGFETRPLATRILSVGQQWAHLYN